MIDYEKWGDPFESPLVLQKNGYDRFSIGMYFSEVGPV